MNYSKLSNAIKDEQLPSMLVDIDQFDENLETIINIAKKHDKKLRPATKSLRVPYLINRIKKIGGDTISGFMCYSCDEASFLSSMGIDNLLIAYPTLQKSELDTISKLISEGKQIYLMIDSKVHIDLISSIIKDQKVSVCIDVDMSYRPLGNLIHLGVQRSPIRDMKSLEELVEYIQTKKNIKIKGIMGYEAQVAGLADNNKYLSFLNPIKYFIRKQSVKYVKKFREIIANYIAEQNIHLDFFNGGGTGSLLYTSQEKAITEITAGSGFLHSKLFDYYSDAITKSAFTYALPISRYPQENIITCKSGGFMASGEVSQDKAPVPFLPKNMKLIATEGCGEVQTPLKLPSNIKLNFDSPIFFRPAKSGEIAEHFNEYLILKNNLITKKVQTYRGLNKVFY